jgi:hypothetical protein
MGILHRYMFKKIQLMYAESNKILFRVSGFLSQTLIMLEW